MTLVDSGARRSQGVYYTPEDVVTYIIEETLGPLLRPWEARAAGAPQEALSAVRALRVLDPACGGGAFLLGALTRLTAAYRAIARGFGADAPPELARPAGLALAENLRGVDVDAGALAVCALALRATAASLDGGPLPPAPSLHHGDLLALADVRRALGGPVDAVVGNPPYARPTPDQLALARRAGLRAADAGDVYPLFVEAALELLAPDGRAGLIVPLSLLYSRATRTLREDVLAAARRELRVASFDRIPSGLFEAEVRTRTSILLAGPRGGAARWRTTPLLRFTARERPHVFERLAFADVTRAVHPSLGVPRVASPLQAEWLARLVARGERLGDATAADGPARLHFKHNCYAFAIVCATLPPAFDADGAPAPQTKYSSLGFAAAADRDVALACTAGAWLFWWWLALGDGFDVTVGLVQAFPVDPRRLPPEVRARLAALGRRIQARAARHVVYKKNSGKRIGTFDLRACLELTAEADLLLARALGAEDLLADVRSALARTHGSAWWAPPPGRCLGQTARSGSNARLPWPRSS
ncbi:MAG: N-6 DNA methylase [Planctomycetes bacterium]|nr:N-6 DNA methylase [Planctomycetota bacterium]